VAAFCRIGQPPMLYPSEGSVLIETVRSETLAELEFAGVDAILSGLRTPARKRCFASKHRKGNIKCGRAILMYAMKLFMELYTAFMSSRL
jgi:hypothetical protein